MGNQVGDWHASLRPNKHFMLKCLERLLSPVNKTATHAEVEMEELFEHGWFLLSCKLNFRRQKHTQMHRDVPLTGTDSRDI